MPLSTEAQAAVLDRARKKSRKLYSDLQDIGDPPECENPERREACSRDLDLFCQTYMGDVFYLPSARFHEVATQKMETAVLDGGQFAWAQPRGSGKTSRAEACVLWSILYGHRSFVLFVGASEGAATQRLTSVKVRLETSDLLFEDFPEVCYPIRSLNRTPRRAATQKLNGEFTYIGWTAGEITMPTVPGSVSSGACLRVAGITSSIRGMSHTRPDGTVIRPDLVIVDDPQSRDSAKSVSQTADRLAILAADIAYLAGPGQPISLLVPCTIIYDNDMASQLLDREKYPQFRGEKTKMVISMPTNMRKWQEYDQILRDSLRNDGDHEPATAFYKQNQAEMDAGAVVSWPERKAPHQLSAIQHAMDLYFRDPASFASEMQNDPIEAQEGSEGACKAGQVADKISHLARYQVPNDTTTVVAGIDVQRDVLYYVITAFDESYRGNILDYGVWPAQKRRSFSLREIRTTLREHYESTSVEAAWFAGLVALVADIKAKPLIAEGKSLMGTTTHSVDAILIDAGYGESTSLVKEVCRKLGGQVYPSFGRGIRATSQPMHLWAKQRGERIGAHWRLRRDKETSQKYLMFDSNYWKGFAHKRFLTDFGERGCMSLFGRAHNNRPLDKSFHRDFANQFCAEFPKLVESVGRKVNEWFLKQAVTDNHFLDATVMCCVAASLQGIGFEGTKRRQMKARAETSMKDFFGR